MPPPPLLVSLPPSSPPTPSLLPPLYHPPPHLSAILPLLCLPHQLVHHLHLSTRWRNHTCLSPSNRGGPQGLKTFIQLNHLNRESHLHQLFNDPTRHKTTFHVEHGPLQELLCIHCSPGFE